MKNVRSFIVGSAILTVATGAVMSSPSATFAQNEPAGKGGFGQRTRMHRMADTGAPLISIALKHRTWRKSEPSIKNRVLRFSSNCGPWKARSRNCASKARQT